MAISGISMNKVSSNVTSSAVSPIEVESKSIQNQITNKQQSLNRLSSDSEMSAEEKAKERQEIQKQIAELNRKLRMLRMEKEEEAEKAEKEQEQKKVLSDNQMKEALGEEADKTTTDKEIEEQERQVNVSPQNIQKILEAESLVQKERIQQSVHVKKEQAVNILETEIKSDELKGEDTSGKKEKLSHLIKEEAFDVTIKEPQEQQGDYAKKSQAKIILREDR